MGGFFFFCTVGEVGQGEEETGGPGLGGGGIFFLFAYRKQRPAPSPPLLMLLEAFFYFQDGIWAKEWTMWTFVV